MNILRRVLPETKAESQEIATEPTVHRRVKVTVERETVTVLVRGQPGQAAAEPQTIAVEPACAEEPESRPPELPPPAREDNKKDCP
jgi:hypothetical protein